MNHTRCSSLIPPFLIGVLALTSLHSCRNSPASPESFAQKLATQLQRLDPQGSGIFHESTERPDDSQMIITYKIARVEDVDDPWNRRREVVFLFRPAPDDPKAMGGWYLDRVSGNYLERLGEADGLMFSWEYDNFQTERGTCEGITALSGVRKVR